MSLSGFWAGLQQRYKNQPVAAPSPAEELVVTSAIQLCWRL